MTKPKKLTLGDILPKYTIDDVLDRTNRGWCEECSAEIERAESEIDRHIDRLQSFVGRELLDIELVPILDIVDENSTKDEEGNIMLLFSFIQAWKIYEFKCGSNKLDAI